ncbi:hypothetical protein FRB94_006615 [Tulasnella sp. JGI-2019a]|nr:hypothetical protein FRB94_006615 [Tulasnella sp. JGI-2019a]KAG9030446.1 hypothetical protein FRB95_003952 [Tulasnella sp. JGI-2019a]
MRYTFLAFVLALVIFLQPSNTAVAALVLKSSCHAEGWLSTDSSRPESTTTTETATVQVVAVASTSVALGQVSDEAAPPFDPSSTLILIELVVECLWTIAHVIFWCLKNVDKLKSKQREQVRREDEHVLKMSILELERLATAQRVATVTATTTTGDDLE